MFDTTDDDSNGESVLEGSELNVNTAAVSRRPKKSILKGKGKKLFKSSEMPTGAVAKMMASEQVRMIDNNNNVLGQMTYCAKMTNIDYTRCDSLVQKKKNLSTLYTTKSIYTILRS